MRLSWLARLDRQNFRRDLDGVAMSLNSSRRRFRLGAAYHDHVYSDLFGNLVIQSPNGFKRIIVGQGHLANKLKKYEGADDSTAYATRTVTAGRQRLSAVQAIATGRRISARAAATCTVFPTASSRRPLASRP